MKDRAAFYRQVGERIRDVRKARGLSQEGLASALGLKRPSMSNIEKGRQNLLLHTFCEISEILDEEAKSLLPSARKPSRSRTPDLRALPENVRAFVEAGIQTANKKQG